MRANEYRLMQECVEVGVERGWKRAHKHTENPNEYDIRSTIEEAVTLEICEQFQFEYTQEQEESLLLEAFRQIGERINERNTPDPG